MTPEDLAAKLSFMEAFFDDLTSKLSFTLQLERNDRDDEARTLCCIYIEAVGNGLYYPSVGYAGNFSKALIEHSGQPVFAVASPQWLIESLPFGGIAPELAKQIRDTLAGRDAQVGIVLTDLVESLQSDLTPSAYRFLEAEGWRGTVARAVYQSMRSPGAHWFGSPQALEFSRTTYLGAAVPTIGFDELHTAATSIVAHARGLSVSSGMWFGTF